MRSSECQSGATMIAETIGVRRALRRLILVVFVVVPPTCEAVRAEAPAESKASIRIVTLGDSITRGVRAGVNSEETFAALLQVGLKDKGVAAEVVNLGIGGERTD